jgi:hypothetical protein
MFKWFNRQRRVTDAQLAEHLWMFLRSPCRDFYTGLESIAKKHGCSIERNTGLSVSFEILAEHILITQDLLKPQPCVYLLVNRYLSGIYSLGDSDEKKLGLAREAELELFQRTTEHDKALSSSELTADIEPQLRAHLLAGQLAELMICRCRDGLQWTTTLPLEDKEECDESLYVFVHQHILQFVIDVLRFREGFDIIQSA